MADIEEYQYPAVDCYRLTMTQLVKRWYSRLNLVRKSINFTNQQLDHYYYNDNSKVDPSIATTLRC